MNNQQKVDPSKVGFVPECPPPSYDQIQFQSHSQPPQQQHHQIHYQPTFVPQVPVAPQVITVVTQQVLGPDPTIVTCPSCHHQSATKVEFEASAQTHLCALLICFLFWPCFCLPYVTDSCKNANHYCSNCGAYIGSHYTG